MTVLGIAVRAAEALRESGLPYNIAQQSGGFVAVIDFVARTVWVEHINQWEGDK